MPIYAPDESGSGRPPTSARQRIAALGGGPVVAPVPRLPSTADLGDLGDNLGTVDTFDSVGADGPNGSTADRMATAGWVPDETTMPESDGEPAPSSLHISQLMPRGAWRHLTKTWVPEGLRTARVDPGRRGTAVLAVIAALAAVIAAVGIWWQRPVPVPIGPADSLASLTAADGDLVAAEVAGSIAAGPAGAGGTGGGAGAVGEDVASPEDGNGPSPPAWTDRPPDGPILVSVTGAVLRPGLVTVSADARVADAIAAAGGALDENDLTGLNLAAHLGDGDSVVVAGPSGSSVSGEAPAGSAGAAAGGADPGPVNINTAGESALLTLPGVGPVTAKAIIDHRVEHGAFADPDDLIAVPGIGPATLARLRPLVTT